MSDLRKRLTKAAVESLGEHVYEASAAHATIQEAYWPIIEAELQKRDKEHFDSLVKAESECLEETEQLSAKLTEANELLEQTIEVLEEERKRVTVWFEHATHFEEELGNLRARTLAVLEACPIPETVAGTTRWWEAKAKPLLDNLKALKKEGTDG